MFMQEKLTYPNLKWKKLLNSVLALVLVFVMLFAAGCTTNKPDDDDDDDDDDDTTPTSITLPIKNGDFENSGSTTQYPQTVKDWTSSYTSFNDQTSSSTNSKAGVVNVNEDKFEGITDGNLLITGDNDKDTISMDKGELNPGTLFSDKISDESNVLMIANKTANAYKYKSGTINLPANTYAKITVFVNAFAIKQETSGEGQITYHKANFDKGGAFIGISGTETPAILKNISTVGAAPITAEEIKAYAIADLENSQDSSFAYQADKGFEARRAEIENADLGTIPGGWKKYELYVEGSASASTSLSLELGLGLGDSKNTSEYVKGYAFFDQVTVEYLTQAEYAETVGTLPEEAKFEVKSTDEANDLSYTAPSVWQCDSMAGVSEGEIDEAIDSIAYSCKGSKDTTTYAPVNSEKKDPADIGYIRDDLKDLLNSNVNADVKDITDPDNKDFFTGERFLKEKEETVDILDENGVPEKDEDGNKKTETVTRTDINPIDNYPFADGNVYVLYNDSLAAFGVKLDLGDFKIEAEEYYRVSVWLKTSDYKRGDVSLNFLYRDKREAFTAINTTASDLSLDTLKTPTNANLNDDWVEYSFYIKGGKTGEDNISLELWLGPRTISGKTDADVTETGNYVMASGVTVDRIPASEYTGASTGDTVKSVSVEDKEGTDSINGQFNSYNENQEFVTDRVKNPTNWTYLTKEGETPSVSDSIGGIFSVKDAENYVSGSSADKSYETYLNEIGETADSIREFFKYNYINNENALMLANYTTNASGFRSPSATISADGYALITVRVRTVNGGKVKLQLVDADGKVLKIEGLHAVMKKDEDGKETDEVDYLEEYANGGELLFQDLSSEDGWTTYGFLIKNGGEAITCHLELWLEGTTDSYSYAFFDQAYMNTSATKEDYKRIKEEGLPESDLALDNLQDYDYSVLYDEPARDDATTDDDTGDDDTTDDGTDTNVPGTFDWTALTMILIAVALLFALGAIVFKKVKSSKALHKKAPKQGKASYHRDNVKYSSKKNTDNKEDEDSAEDADEDEETEENGEEPVEETQSDTAEETPAEESESSEDDDKKE